MRYSNSIDENNSSKIDLACSMLIKGARDKYGEHVGCLAELREYVVSTMGLGDTVQALERLERIAVNPWNAQSICSEDEALMEPVANAALIWCVVENSAPNSFSFEQCLFEPQMVEGLQLYEQIFGRLTGQGYKKVLNAAAVRDHTKYKVLNRQKRNAFETSVIAWQCLGIQKKLCEGFLDDGLRNQLVAMEAFDLICVLTNGQADLRAKWAEDDVSYLLACELLEALADFYEDAFEKTSNEENMKISTLEDVYRFADRTDMELKLECFLDGVSTEDILA